MEFINRVKDIDKLNSFFANEPNSIMFVYGPKSSGKSTLLAKIAEDLNKKEFAVNFLDLRQVIIYNFKTFLNVFFPKSIRDKAQDILSGLTLNAGFFSVKMEEESILEENAFKIIVDKLISAKKRGIHPIIIIDEIQLLKNIYVNGERYLIDELFNLFIALTKVRHICHIVLATSDSYFIEDIYNSAKLQKTSEFFLLDHFDKESVYNWLTKKGFDVKDIEIIWDYVGGCPWEINQIIQMRNEKSIELICEDFITENYGKVNEFRLNMEDKALKAQFDAIIKTIVEKGSYLRNDAEDTKMVKKLLSDCIELDIWFYVVDKHEIRANSKSIYHAFKMITAKL